MSLSVGDLEAAIAARFPLERAESWDRNGLLAGDRSRGVTGVRVALDPTLEVIARAVAAGENVLVTHHPAALSMPAAIVAGSGSVLFAALDAGVALLNAHTNLDRDPVAQRRLPELLGLGAAEPLESALAPMALVTVFVPPAAAEAVTEGMASAGAGRVGDYTACSFAAAGVGRYTVPESGKPAAGVPGSAERADEVRVEMICPTPSATRVVEACRRAHPYEEPLIAVAEVEIGRNAARIGMVSSALQDETLGSLADRCFAVFGSRPRVWGDRDRPITRVATTTGSGGSLIADARSRGANALVAGEVRYHDAMAAGDLSVVEIGHDVSEWPLVEVLADAVFKTPGLDAATVTVEPASSGWWTP